MPMWRRFCSTEVECAGPREQPAASAATSRNLIGEQSGRTARVLMLMVVPTPNLGWLKDETDQFILQLSEVALSYQSLPSGMSLVGVLALTQVATLIDLLTVRTLPSPRPTCITPVCALCVTVTSHWPGAGCT